MTALRYPLLAALALAAPIASACSVSVPRFAYIQVVELKGPKVQGLQWFRIFNILDYEGGGRIVVSGIREGGRFPIAKWENGQQCLYDRQRRESCEPNEPLRGIKLENILGPWVVGAARREVLKRFTVPLIVEADGREFEMSLRSRVVNNTRELQATRAAQAAGSCPDVE